MSVHTENYDEVVAAINRKYEGDIKRGDEYDVVEGIPTLSPELNAAMGGKGVPQGRWTRFYGGYHSTKTLNALGVMGNAQKMGMNVAYYNVEKQFDHVFAKKFGVNPEEVTLVEGTSIEEIGEKMESLLGVVHVHVIDSCTIAVSEDELNADIRDWRPGLNARAWGKVFRRLNERFDPFGGGNTVILIDQTRIDFRSGSEQAAGGQIFDFQSSMSVMFRRSQWLHRNPEGVLDEKAKQEKGASGQMEPAGYEVKARIEKSRVCRPFRTATLRLDLDEMQFDRTFEYLKNAKHYGLVRQGGKWWYILDPKSGEVADKVQGDKGLREYIEKHKAFKTRIETTMLSAARDS